MKPEDLITNSSLSNIVIGMDIVPASAALIAVCMARVEERNNAVETYRKTCKFNTPDGCYCKNDDGECGCQGLKNFIAELN